MALETELAMVGRIAVRSVVVGAVGEVANTIAAGIDCTLQILASLS
jgi:hypothetical protein